jgi:chromosome transmission fidelity protein 1
MDNHDADRDFHHPYEPYEIQYQFMNAVYDCLEDRKVGIFESPTGTGKSLSLICASLNWLRDHKRRNFEDGFEISAADRDDPPWMLDHARKQRKQDAFRRKQELNERLAMIKAKESRAKERSINGVRQFKRQKTNSDEAGDENAEARFALDDYASDQEHSSSVKSDRFDNSGLSAETQALMDKLGYAVGDTKTEAAEAIDETKIFFCSRTHSQLTQFSSELAKVKIPPAILLDDETNTDDVDGLVEDVKHLTLGSRKNLCINPKVKRLGNATAINERCLELQQSATSEGKCSFMPTQGHEDLLHDFRDHALAKIRDIEDLGALGDKLGICPYYASRPATRSCEVRIHHLILQEAIADLLDRDLTLPAASATICT